MSWLAWCLVVIVSSVNYQTSMKIFSGRLPIFVYTTIASVSMLVISLIALAMTYKPDDLAALNQKNVLLALWLGIACFMIEFGFYFLYKNNAPISLARMITLAGSAIILLLIGILFFKERLTLNQIIGMLFSMLGLIMIIRK
ncbi:MAG TPA: EamA family transporter [Alphaproteobacteria bacterium]